MFLKNQISPATILNKHRIVFWSLVFLLYLLPIKPVYAHSKGLDTVYIKDYSSKLMFKTYGTYSRTTMPYNLPKKLPVIDLTTNSYVGIGLAFSYKWLGFGYAFNVVPVGDPALFGKTSSFDLYFSIYQPKHLIDLMYTDNRGFISIIPKPFFGIGMRTALIPLDRICEP